MKIFNNKQYVENLRKLRNELYGLLHDKKSETNELDITKTSDSIWEYHFIHISTVNLVKYANEVTNDNITEDNIKSIFYGNKLLVYLIDKLLNYADSIEDISDDSEVKNEESNLTKLKNKLTELLEFEEYITGFIGSDSYLLTIDSGKEPNIYDYKRKLNIRLSEERIYYIIDIAIGDIILEMFKEVESYFNKQSTVNITSYLCGESNNFKKGAIILELFNKLNFK